MTTEMRICRQCNASNSRMVNKCQSCQAPLTKVSEPAPPLTGEVKAPSNTRVSGKNGSPQAAKFVVSIPGPSEPNVHSGDTVPADAAAMPKPSRARAAWSKAHGWSHAMWNALRARPVIIFVVTVAVLAVVFIGQRVRKSGGGANAMMDAVVQVKCGSEVASGFFAAIDGHRDETFVVTSGHVIASGLPVTVVRWFGEGNNHYCLTYQDVSVAAYDHVADVAILKLKHVPPEQVVDPIPLYLGAEAVGEAEDVGVYGYSKPKRDHIGQVDKVNVREGDIDGSVKRPAMDPHLPDTPLELNVDTLKISKYQAQEGHAGGPVIRYRSSGQMRGEAIGVLYQPHTPTDAPVATSTTVLKDRLLAQLDKHPLDAARVQERLRQIVREYLAKDIGLLSYKDFAQNIALVDVNHVRQFAHKLAQPFAEDKNSKDPTAGGRAKMKMRLARTDISANDYDNNSSVMSKARLLKVAPCIKKDFLEVAPIDMACEAPLQRALAHDMMKSLLRYKKDLKETDYEVTNAPVANGDAPFTVGVRVAGKTFNIKMLEAQGQLWIPLFDDNGFPWAARQGDTDYNVFFAQWKSVGEPLPIDIVVRGDKPTMPEQHFAARIDLSIEFKAPTKLAEEPIVIGSLEATLRHHLTFNPPLSGCPAGTVVATQQILGAAMRLWGEVAVLPIAMDTSTDCSRWFANTWQAEFKLPQIRSVNTLSVMRIDTDDRSKLRLLTMVKKDDEPKVEVFLFENGLKSGTGS